MNYILLLSMGGFLLLEFVLFTKEAIHTAIVSRRLNKYLKDKHYSLWRKLTSFKTIGPGVVNSARSLPWLFRDDPEEEDELVHLKDIVRVRTRWFFITGGAFFFTVICMFVAAIVYAIFM